MDLRTVDKDMVGVRTERLDIPEGMTPEGYLEQQQREARKRPQELESFGRRSQGLVGEIEKLEAAKEEQAAQAERLGETLESHLAELDMLRANQLIGEVDQEQVGIAEEAVDRLREQLAEARSAMAGINILLRAKYEKLEAAQLQDLEAAIDRNGKALTKAKATFLGLLGPTASDLKAAGLQDKQGKWQELVDERLELLEALYHPDRVGGSANRAARQIRSELIGDYGLFSGDVARDILDLGETLLPLFEVRQGRPVVRGR